LTLPIYVYTNYQTKVKYIVFIDYVNIKISSDAKNNEGRYLSIGKIKTCNSKIYFIFLIFMPSKKTTTVVFTKKAQEIKDRLTPAFGLKGILSASLQLFDELDDSEKIARVAEAKKQEDVIAEANGKIDKPNKHNDDEVGECIENIKHFVKYHLPSEEERRLIESLKQALGPEPKNEKKRKRG